MDENYFLYFEETDFCYRAKKAGFATWYVPESRVMHIMGQSTTVTDLTRGPKRLPSYWFESRRRYFAMTYGIGHAIGIDIVALLACSIGAREARRSRARAHRYSSLRSGSYPPQRHMAAKPQVSCRTMLIRRMAEAMRVK